MGMAKSLIGGVSRFLKALWRILWWVHGPVTIIFILYTFVVRPVDMLTASRFLALWALWGLWSQERRIIIRRIGRMIRNRCQ
jgi:hypothetical protein